MWIPAPSTVERFNRGILLLGVVVDTRTAVTAVLALLAVLALGASAATLDSATTATDSGGFGAGSSDDSGLGNRDTDGAQLGGPGSSGATLGLSLCVSFLTRPLVQLALLAGVALFFGLMYRTTGSGFLSGMFVLSAALPVGFVYFALISCGQPPTERAASLMPGPTNATGLGSGGGRAGLGGSDAAVSAPTALAGLLLLAAIVGSILLLFVSTGDDEAELADEEPDLPDPDRREAVGTAAGRAADRLEADADLENAVFRAWREMTDLLDVPRPRTSTPAEFADRAVDAGMDREDVDALTAVFEEVRYGGADPTAERERRAVDALRRIEAAYGDRSDGTDGSDG